MLRYWIARFAAMITVAASAVLICACASVPLLTAGPTPVAFSTVAELIHDRPPAGIPVQIDAYYSKYIPGTSIPQVRPGEIGCPEYPAILADTVLQSCQLLTNGDYTCDGPPKGSIFVVAVKAAQITPGQDILPPSLPYHARFVGHLADPKLVHCKDNEKIFVVENIAQIYEEKLPAGSSQ